MPSCNTDARGNAVTRRTAPGLVARLWRFAVASALLSGLGSACAGRSISNGSSEDDAGSAGSAAAGASSHAGTSSAGTTAGGSSAVAGRAAGGFSSVGGSVNTAGGIGASGISAGGSPSPPDISSCNIAADCVLQSGTGCCYICDSPDLTAQNLIAVNVAYAVKPCSLTVKLLPLPIGGTASDIALPNPCSPCQPTGDGALHNFFANCVMNRCVVEDVRQSAVSSCMSDQDCVLRHGTTCCETCNDQDLVAVRNDGSLSKIACSAGPVPCPSCAPAPPTASAVCQQDHCAVAP